MQLNLTTDYAIRIIMYLAQQDEVTNSSQIAKTVCVSQKYVVNIIHKLKSVGLVTAYSGASGGYRLGRKPSDISMKDVIFAMEGTIKINRCLEKDAYCSCHKAATCPVRRFYINIQKAVEYQLEKTTIEHMLKEMDRFTGENP